MAPEFGKPIHQLPLIPADVLKKHRVHEPLDTAVPIGSYPSDMLARL